MNRRMFLVKSLWSGLCLDRSHRFGSLSSSLYIFILRRVFTQAWLGTGSLILFSNAFIEFRRFYSEGLPQGHSS